MIKKIFKLLLCVTVYTIVFSLTNAVLPFSQRFKELRPPENQAALLFLLINAAWVCFTAYYIIRHSYLSRKKLFLNTVFVVFFVQSFMMQIETALFGYAFSVLTRLDYILITLAGLPPVLAAVLLLVIFFQNKNIEDEKTDVNVKSILKKLGIIGIIYVCVYMLFGYFVAWQFEELRLFYSGSPEKLSFWRQLANNFKTNPLIYPFQILRGILFGVFVLPLKFMIKGKNAFRISVCLVYLCTAMLLVIPNPLFPDMVRIAHLLEMTSSMLLFGIIAGSILQDRTSKRGKK